ncbi:MAG TPA: class I SAM-dependent methyltransferase [Solirubrobacterales bacterium]|nr:class I SAM-dependent methyltransferase [Solirubrobacterales bacterium]
MTEHDGRPGLGRRVYDATWGRLFASIYDRMLADTEEAGMRDRRRELLSRARGRTLEIGAGTGLNFEHYTDAVTELTLTEPFPPMATRLRERVGDKAAVIEAPADRLPAADGSIDTVVCTLVLCTVDDVPATLSEIARVLAPDGRLLFCEHVRSDDPRTARWQDRFERPWKFVGHGCRCNRDTLAAIADSPLEVESVECGTVPKSPAIVRPLVVGDAVRPA